MFGSHSKASKSKSSIFSASLNVAESVASRICLIYPEKDSHWQKNDHFHPDTPSFLRYHSTCFTVTYWQHYCSVPPNHMVSTSIGSVCICIPGGVNLAGLRVSSMLVCSKRRLLPSCLAYIDSWLIRQHFRVKHSTFTKGNCPWAAAPSVFTNRWVKCRIDWSYLNSPWCLTTLLHTLLWEHFTCFECTQLTVRNICT